MSLTSISTITAQIQDRPGWEGVKDWGLIVRAWQATVSPAIADRTQPKSFSRGVLTIATPSSSLTHQLTFGRQALCLQFNRQDIAPPINDLRFVTAGYRQFSLTTTAINTIPIDSGEIVICAQCQCRARQGELLRWGVCQYCAIDLKIL
jgi:predicted nucleic acid-binding Zn ribbon protein